MRVLVIGTSGQLATELHRVDRPSTIALYPAEKVDLTDADAVTALLRRAQPGLVINAAAYTAVDRAETERAQAFAVNALGPGTLAAWCADARAALLHVSTDYVFNGENASSYVETDATEPLGAYGESKLAGEDAVRNRLARHLILRTSWVFSAHGQNFVKTVLRLAKERDELRVVADQRGRPTAAADLARAMLRLAGEVAAGRDPAWGTYHFAGRDVTSWHGFAEAIVDSQARYTNKRPRVTAITTADYPTPAKRPANSALDSTRFEATFGFAPAPWREELDEVVDELLHAG